MKLVFCESCGDQFKPNKREIICKECELIHQKEKKNAKKDSSTRRDKYQIDKIPEEE